MIAALIILVLSVTVIIMIVKFKKVNNALRVLFVFLIFIIVLLCGFMLSQRYWPIKSLPLKTLPQDFTYKIPQDKIEKLHINENDKKYRDFFNGMEFACCQEDLAYYKSDEPLRTITDSNEKNELAENVADSYFTMYYFDFYNEENAEKAMNDILFFRFSSTSYYNYTLPYMDKLIDCDMTVDGNCYYYTCDASDCLIKASKDSNIVSSYSFSTAYYFTGNIFLAFLPGDNYESFCAFRDGQYILFVVETAHKHKETNMFSVLGNNTIGKIIESS